MNLAKKITQILSLILLIALASSCDKQCFTNEEFDVNSVVIDSYPTADGITGDYDAVTGGQVAAWHDTGLKSNGDMFLIRVSGGWTPWGGGTYGDLNQSDLDALPVCKTCAKKDDTNPNCICYAEESSVAEFGQTCDPEEFQEVDGVTTDIKQQENPNLCSCTKDPKYGTTLDYGVYHFPLNYYTKDETLKIADLQTTCKFNRGMGAYIALFGASGVRDPIRAYHLFTDDFDLKGKSTKVCDINLNSDGECRDSSGKDRTSYVFRSADDRIFMKDDREGNNGNNTNTSDDIYHGPNEVVKLKIYDSYYNDNYGQYNVDILRGVGDSGDISSVGILEFVVRLIEDTLLGNIKSKDTYTQIDGEEVKTTTHEREGGIIEFMYKSIVQDSNFALILQITLILYITFFGLAVLMGIAEISKKELMTRLVKICLVIFFTNENSWKFYNDIIVAFFYDSMNYVVSMFMSLSDYALSQGMDTSAILIAQMDRSVDVSSATRFSYIDNTIKMMLSKAFAGKVFSLIFSDFFGLIYVYLIYRLIVYNFIKVMIHAAMQYVVKMMEIIFVLCLGPIFITFSLFAQTNQMFKNWLSYLGARALEIILLFAVLYNFVMLIDVSIRTLLDYSACVEPLSFGGADALGLGGLFSINILKASGIADRSLIVWLTLIFKIAALVFITKLFIDQIQTVAGYLISIGGVANKNSANEGFGQDGADMAASLGLGNPLRGKDKDGIAGNKLLGGLAGLDSIKKDALNLYSGGKFLGGLVSRASDASGLSGALSKAGDLGGANPLKIGRQAGRNSLFDAAIKKAEEKAAAKGLDKMNSAAFVREAVMNKYAPESISKTAAFFGADAQRAGARVDQNFISQIAQDLKSKGLAGKDLENSLRAQAQIYATTVHSKDKAAAADMLKSLDPFIKTASKLPGKEAAKAFANNPDGQNKYLQHLQNKEFQRHNKIATQQQKNDELSQNKFNSLSDFGKYLGNMPDRAGSLVSRGVDGIDRIFGSNPEERNPEAARQTFLRNLKNEERTGWNKAAVLNPLNRSNALDRLNPFSTLNQRTNKAQEDLLRKNLAQGQTSKAPHLRNSASAAEKKAHAASLKKFDEIADRKRIFMQERLRNLATKDLAKEVSRIKKLEAKGKISEANKAKADLLTKAHDSIRMNPSNKSSFQNDGRTIFEKASRLSYLQKQFGIKGEDPTLILSKALRKTAEENTQDLARRLKSGEKISSLANEIADAKSLRSGLFTNAASDQEFAKLAATLGSTLDEIAKNQTNGLKGLTQQGSLVDSANPLKSLKEELKDPLIDRTTQENSYIKSIESNRINLDQKDIQQNSESLDQAISDAQKTEKLAIEKDAASQSKKDSQELFSTLKNVASLKLEQKNEVDETKKEALSAKILEAQKALQEKFESNLQSSIERNEQVKKDIDALGKIVTAFENKNTPEAQVAAKNLQEAINKLTTENSPTALAEFGLAIQEAAAAKSDTVIPGLTMSDLGLKPIDLGLTAPDLGLKASNFLLGVPEETSGLISEAQKKELSMHKNQVNGQLKLNNMNLKIKQFELEQLKGSKGDAAQIAKLESEITNLTKEVHNLETEETKIEAALKT
ncbi:MAG: type IV secretion system protein [Rickettsiales bacterium]|nr:type IV secretion system protein [Rickettsiales bacterium]